MASSAGLEPATHGLENHCSIQLSYEDTMRIIYEAKFHIRFFYSYKDLLAKKGLGSISVDLFTIKSATNDAEPMAKVQPDCPCPEFTNKPSIFVLPKKGKPSALIGRNPYQSLPSSKSS